MDVAVPRNYTDQIYQSVLCVMARNFTDQVNVCIFVKKDIRMHFHERHVFQKNTQNILNKL